MAASAWTDEENDLLVANYFELLALQNSGTPFNKAYNRRNLLSKISRSEKAIEFKQQNVSAVLETLGLPWLKGLMPARNFQGSLVDAVERFVLTNNDLLIPEVQQASFELGEEPTLYMGPPPLPSEPFKQDVSQRLNRIARKIDFAEKDERNRSLGKQGEQIVLQFEKDRLSNAGREDLAQRIQWVSQDQGDGLGYDILSFDSKGNSLFIEVKCTTGGAKTPFLITQNELDFARDNAGAYKLIRVHSMSSKQPQAFELHFPFPDHLNLAPTVFKVGF